MRLRTRTLLMIGLFAFVATAVLWRLGEPRFAGRRAGVAAPADRTPQRTSAPTLFAAHSPAVPAAIAGVPGTPARPSAGALTDPEALRLRNTDKGLDDLLRDDAAVLLRNALIDTASGLALNVPEHLRAATEPGSFIVQARGSITPAFRDGLLGAGVGFVSYLPNNAYLVSATAAQADAIRSLSSVQAVLPFEPYFKLEPGLLAEAVRGGDVVAEKDLTVTLLPGADRKALTAAGVGIRGEFRTPFGQGLVVEPNGITIAALARMPEVQGIELFRERQLLNDLSRRRLGISTVTNAPGAYTNYLGLTGTNVFVNVNDTGIDSTHPDLVGRVTGNSAAILIDIDGHGTHVAGTIAGSGLMSATVSNAPGSTIPGADFRGMAPAAQLYALPVDLITGPLISDAYLQEATATNNYITRGLTNLPISNNSWGYIGAFEYTSASASYDEAVRDALPDVEGMQPILYVFAAGNEGFGGDDGQAGEPNTVRAPGTGKNVITVGALESPRNLTNEVMVIGDDGLPQTNQVFLGETDTDYQIASFSGRGNVEPGVEGRHGRFKPDVVAPGSFTISARSKDWLDPTAFTSALVSRQVNQQVPSGGRNNYSVYVPPDASELRIRILPNLLSPAPFPGLPLYIRYGDIPGVNDLLGTNNIARIPPDGRLEAGDWFYSVGNFEANSVSYDIQTLVIITNAFDSYFEQLKQINDGLAPHYRYESGTSMAAPAVTGLLALFQDYFQRDGKQASPALLKALLINGARSVGSLYNFSVSDVLNIQGWGGVSITNTLPAGEIGVSTGAVHAVQYADHKGTNSLVTGQSRSWNLKVAPAGADQVLKFTLVWTDPPGNPNASVKLVNDLDLVVKNLDTGETFVGNDIPFRSDFNVPRAEGDSVTNDVINNVENILIRPPLGTNYQVSVNGRRINVNAVTAQPNGIAQDFALAVSVENTRLENVLSFTPTLPDPTVNIPFLITPTNGLPLLSQRVGANPPRFGVAPGATNQWTFLVFTNLQALTPSNVGLTNGPYVAFITFLPPNLSQPRTREADIDLYVSTDSSLTNLNPVAVQNALKSTKPGGTELVFFTNSVLGSVYYIGVKAEDQQASEFGFVALSSNLPFDEEDEDGNRIVRGMPFWVAIPDGSPDEPQAAYIFGIATQSFPVQRVVATNTMVFDSTGDILLNLAHNGAFAVLNNHALDPTGRGGEYTAVFDDSNAGDTSYGSLIGRPSDGPGSLRSFVGTDATGPWILSAVDNALTQVATNVALTLLLERQPEEDEYFYTTVLPNSVNYYYIDLPRNATNLTVLLTGIDPNLPLFVGLRRGEEPTLTEYDKGAIISAPGGSISLGTRDTPPLNPGRYYIGVFNQNGVSVNYGILVEYEVDSNVSNDQAYTLTTVQVIPDDARTLSTINVADDRQIADIKVGIRVDHPRVADLSFHLTSPQGTRLLLAENRGGSNGVAYGADRGDIQTFTMFTDDTNLTSTPIKIGIPAFTNNAAASTASNRVVMADSFEDAPARTYVAGERIPRGWRVIGGQAAVVRVPVGSTNRFDGDQYVLLGAGASSIGTNVVMSQGALYRMRFGSGRTVGSQIQGIDVFLNGRLIYELKSDAQKVGWYPNSFLFGATARDNLIEFRTPGGSGGAASPLAIDNVIIEEADPPLNAYYLPEEALKPFIGQRSLGDWILEVTDSRAGPPGATPAVLRNWRLEMVYALPAIDAIRLTNGVPYFGTVDGTDVTYFYVDAPFCSTISTNILAGELATLLLFGDRDGLPLADLNRFQDDYGPFLNVEGGGRATLTLTTNFPASAPLIPGQRYYLAVKNFQPDRTDNPYGIMVQFDCEDPPLPVVPSLTNGIPVRTIIQPGPVLDYYQFVVSSNAIQAEFELTPVSGANVDMFIKQGRIDADPQPLPSPNNYDYKSDLSGVTDVDFVRVDRTSVPVGLTPGVWFIAVRNADVVPAEYTLKATERYTTIINLTNAVAHTATILPVADPLLGVQGADLHYYAFLVSSNAVQATFETLDADGDVNLFVRRGLPIPTPSDFHFAGLNPGNADEFIAVTNTTTPIWLSPGWWYLSVLNAEATNVTYSILATETPGTIIPLTNDVPVTNTVAAGTAPDYYSFNVSPSALSAKFEVYGMSAGVDLLLHRGLPLATLNDFTYQSSNPGTTDEFIELTPLSFPIGLTPGPWYLSILNPGNGNATYTVRASEATAQVIPLTNGVPYNAALPSGGGLDYYQFLVETNALAAEFKLTSAGAGNLDLYLRKGPPLPDAGNAHYAATTAGNGDELIRLEPNSVPVPLSPGLWYLSVTNNEAVPIGYEITATQFGVEPPPISGQVTNIVITDTNTCITWISIPTTNYFVVGKTNALDAVWTPLSPTITAVGTSTTWCLEPPGPWRFFDVLEGESPSVPIPAPAPVLRLDGVNICVGFFSVPGTNYYIQAKKVSTDPDWVTLTPSIRATGPFTEVCYPLEWGYRFFRVGVGELSAPDPAPLPPEVVTVDVTVENLCVSWPTKPGLDYLVEAKREATEPNWSVISEAIRGDGTPAKLCLDAATEFRFFRIIEGVSVPPGAPPSVPVPNISLTVDAAFQLCLAWDTLLGAEYFVEAKERFADPAWTVVSPILTASGIQLSYCVPLNSTWRYYQVRRVNRAPNEPPRIADIEVVANGLRLNWTGVAGGRYQVFYTDTFPVLWKPAGNPVTSITTTFEYLDTGASTGGFSGFRIYRIELLP